MRKVLLSFLLLLCSSAVADAACSGTQLASSFSLTAPITEYYRDTTSCAVISGTSVSFSPVNVASATPSGSAFILAPVSNGTTTMTVTAAGYQTSTFSVTVTLGQGGFFSQ